MSNVAPVTITLFYQIEAGSSAPVWRPAFRTGENVKRALDVGGGALAVATGRWASETLNSVIMTNQYLAIGAFIEETRTLLSQLDQEVIAHARDLLLDCYQRQGRVFTLGNGGSASTAQHFACDLAKFAVPPDQRPFDARCLTDNASLYTAWANDADRADVFVNMMRFAVQHGDVVIACSVHGGQGYSADLVRAVRFANNAGASTISLVGFDGGMMHRESTVSILVPVHSTPQVESIHLVIEHLLMSLIKTALGGSLEEK